MNSKVVEQESRLKVVGAVEDQVKTLQEFGNISRSEVANDTLDFDLRIQLSKLGFRSHSLWQCLAGVIFVEKRLPVEVGWLDKVAIDDTKSSHSGPRKQLGRRSTDGAATHNDSARCQQFALAFLAHACKENLARVSFRNGVNRQDE